MRFRTPLGLALVWVGAMAACSSGTNSTGLPGYGARCTSTNDCGSATPTCSGGFCVECASNAQCTSGEHPVCSVRGFCGDCSSSADCGGRRATCDVAAARCVECLSASGCEATESCTPRGDCEPACTTDAQCTSGEMRRCDPALRVCVECTGSADCPRERPFCDDQARCRECLSNGDCGAGQPFCIEGECRECRQNLDCGAGGVCSDHFECTSGCRADGDCREGDRPACDPSLGQCFECVTDAHCGGETPVCIDHECRQCRSDVDCPADEPVCRDDHACHNNG